MRQTGRLNVVNVCCDEFDWIYRWFTGNEDNCEGLDRAVLDEHDLRQAVSVWQLSGYYFFSRAAATMSI